MGVPLARELRRPAAGRARAPLRPGGDRSPAHRRGRRGRLSATADGLRSRQHRPEPRLLPPRRAAVGTRKRCGVPRGGLAPVVGRAAGRLAGGARARTHAPGSGCSAAPARPRPLQPRHAVRSGGRPARAALRPAGDRACAGTACRAGRAGSGRGVRLGAAAGARLARPGRRRLRATDVRVRLLCRRRAVRRASRWARRDPGRRRTGRHGCLAPPGRGRGVRRLVRVQRGADGHRGGGRRPARRAAPPGTTPLSMPRRTASTETRARRSSTPGFGRATPGGRRSSAMAAAWRTTACARTGRSPGSQRRSRISSSWGARSRRARRTSAWHRPRVRASASAAPWARSRRAATDARCGR